MNTIIIAAVMKGGVYFGVPESLTSAWNPTPEPVHPPDFVCPGASEYLIYMSNNANNLMDTFEIDATQYQLQSIASDMINNIEYKRKPSYSSANDLCADTMTLEMANWCCKVIII